jgi:hypothetical protein
MVTRSGFVHGTCVMRVRGVTTLLALSVNLLAYAVTEFQNVIQEFGSYKVLIAKFLGMITGVY